VNHGNSDDEFSEQPSEDDDIVVKGLSLWFRRWRGYGG
jgi:hypothetical protein